MPLHRETISRAAVDLPRGDLKAMIRLVRVLHRLGNHPAYRQKVLPELPEIARFDPGHAAVMMGYDFHLTPEGPRLIEINTNAGGALLAYLAHHPDASLARARLPEALRRQFLATFAAEMRAFSGGRRDKPRRAAIIDECPRDQYLFPEMEVFRDLLAEWGVPAVVADPARLEASEKGVACDGAPVDLIYNRHCDFYLESAAMAGIRAAYRARTVCLTPNPHAYGLLADKRRLILLSDPKALAELDLAERDRDLLAALIPESRLLAGFDRETLWPERKAWVFKPVARFGSRGVLLGRAISKKRFGELPPESTLVQRAVPPSLTPVPGEEPMKTDLRLYVYRDRVLGVAARLYRGQVTNLRTAGGGFAPVRVVR